MNEFKRSFKLKDTKCLSQGNMNSENYTILGNLDGNLYLLQLYKGYRKVELIYRLEGLELIYCMKTNLNSSEKLEVDTQKCLCLFSKKIE